MQYFSVKVGCFSDLILLQHLYLSSILRTVLVLEWIEVVQLQMIVKALFNLFLSEKLNYVL